MKKIIEKNVAEIIMLSLFTVVFMSSCGSTEEMKDCCKKTVQEVYEYEGLVVSQADYYEGLDCVNCDEID